MYDRKYLNMECELIHTISHITIAKQHIVTTEKAAVTFYLRADCTIRPNNSKKNNNTNHNL